MKRKFFTGTAFLLALASCSNSVEARYKSVQTQKLLLESREGKVYELTIEKDSTGKDMLGIHEAKP